MYMHKFTYVLYKGSLLFLFSIYLAIIVWRTVLSIVCVYVCNL